MSVIDLNADVGEGLDDAALYPIVTSVNIACGAHAGDDDTMARAVALAAEHGCAVGAHPGYVDRENFGRAPMHLGVEELQDLLVAQIHRLGRFASEAGTGIRHVKPHGALYNQAAADPMIASVIAATVAEIHPALMVVGLAGSQSIAAARAIGAPVAEEAFADRRYLADGSLAPRGTPGALIEDPAQAAAQAVALARGEAVATADGGTVTVRADTICCHGDTPGSLAIARAVREALTVAGFTVAGLHTR